MLPKRNSQTAAAKPETKAPAFETIDDETGAEGGGEDTGEETTALSPAARLAAAAAERAASAEAAKTTAVAAVKPNAVSVHKALENPLAPLKNAFTVEYDTLRNLIITNGNVMDRDTNKALGDVITLELLSFQDQWVVSPGVDGDEGKELVRYSNDGVTTTKGESCESYLAQLKEADYTDAKMSKRTVICGALVDSGKLKELQDSLVQINLPPTSKAAFERYQMDQAYRISRGLIQGEGAQKIRLECTLTTKGANTWTVASFTRA